MGVLLDIFFPPTCVACARVLPSDSVLCDECGLQVEPLPSSHCALCSEPGEHPRHCPRCRRSPPEFDRAYSPFIHEGALAKAIHQFKYEDHPESARPLGRLLKEGAQDFLLDAPKVICAIPLHVSRMRERRFDQSALLAREVAKHTGRVFEPDLLNRVRKTKRQVGLSEAGRARNVNEAFAVKGAAPLEVLLVDDVLTTGATARAAAAALKAKGARRVEVLTLARAYSSLV